MKRIYFVWMVLLSLAHFGCGDFLEEYSQDLVYANSCEDLDEVLIGNGYMASPATSAEVLSGDYLYYVPLFVMDDDVDLLVASDPYGNHGRPNGYYYYVWEQDPLAAASESTTRQQEDDKTLIGLYEHIAYVNTIVNYVDEFPNDPIEDRRRIKGEGQFLRGAYYLLLNNLYGHAYDARNGGSDWGVPLKTFEYVVEDHFGRASVKEIYEQIVADLEEACDNLQGIEQPSIYRADQMAARILLSRVYLHMEDYDHVIEQCDSALAEGIQLMDLNACDLDSEDDNLSTRDYILSEENPEIVFTMGGSASLALFKSVGGDQPSYEQYAVSEALLAEFEKYGDNVKDLRGDSYFRTSSVLTSKVGLVKTRYFVKGDDGYWDQSDVRVFDTFVLRTPEIYLNKAEAQAMKGDVAGAVSTLQPYLAARYATGMQPSITSFGEQELVEFIRSERRKEFCFEGHRWPDLKRYAVNSKYPYNEPIRHTVYTPVGQKVAGDYAGYYELGKYGEDDGWILAFPLSEITYNDGKLENPERPQRLNGDPAYREEEVEEN